MSERYDSKHQKIPLPLPLPLHQFPRILAKDLVDLAFLPFVALVVEDQVDFIKMREERRAKDVLRVL